MAKAWCLLKPGGRAIVGIPMGPDVIEYNAHRLYGPKALAQLFANFKQIYTATNFTLFHYSGCSWCYQTLHVLEKDISSPE